MLFIQISAHGIIIESNNNKKVYRSIISFAYESFDQRNEVLTVLSDHFKAFDPVDHNILFNKLKRLGVRDSAFKWLKTYLINRRQIVTKSTDYKIWCSTRISSGTFAIFTVFIYLLERSTGKNPLENN